MEFCQGLQTEHRIIYGWDGLTASTFLYVDAPSLQCPEGITKGARLGMIRVERVHRAPLNRISQQGVARQGFPDWTREDFITWYTHNNNCFPNQSVLVVRFRICQHQTAIPLPCQTSNPSPSSLRNSA